MFEPGSENGPSGARVIRWFFSKTAPSFFVCATLCQQNSAVLSVCLAFYQIFGWLLGVGDLELHIRDGILFL